MDGGRQTFAGFDASAKGVGGPGRKNMIGCLLG